MTPRARWEARQTVVKKRTDMEAIARFFQQAELAMEALTADPNWNALLQMVEHRQLKDRDLVAAGSARLASDEFLQLEPLAKLRHEMALAQARIAAREEIIAIPKELLAAAKGF